MESAVADAQIDRRPGKQVHGFAFVAALIAVGHDVRAGLRVECGEEVTDECVRDLVGELPAVFRAYSLRFEIEGGISLVETEQLKTVRTASDAEIHGAVGVHLDIEILFLAVVGAEEEFHAGILAGLGRHAVSIGRADILLVGDETHIEFFIVVADLCFCADVCLEGKGRFRDLQGGNIFPAGFAYDAVFFHILCYRQSCFVTCLQFLLLRRDRCFPGPVSPGFGDLSGCLPICFLLYGLRGKMSSL